MNNWSFVLWVVGNDDENDEGYMMLTVMTNGSWQPISNNNEGTIHQESSNSLSLSTHTHTHTHTHMHTYIHTYIQAHIAWCFCCCCDIVCRRSHTFNFWFWNWRCDTMIWYCFHSGKAITLSRLQTLAFFEVYRSFRNELRDKKNFWFFSKSR